MSYGLTRTYLAGSVLYTDTHVKTKRLFLYPCVLCADGDTGLPTAPFFPGSLPLLGRLNINLHTKNICIKMMLWGDGVVACALDVRSTGRWFETWFLPSYSLLKQDTVSLLSPVARLRLYLTLMCRAMCKKKKPDLPEGTVGVIVEFPFLVRRKNNC